MRAKWPLIEVDLDDDIEEAESESSSEVEEIDPSAFELVKPSRDDRTSTSGAATLNPPKKCKEISQD